MNTFPLQLIPAGRAVHIPAGWFIPGGDPAIWLEELAQWGVPLEQVRLYILPPSRQDRRAAGVLVVAEEGRTPIPTPRALAYGRLSGRLYVPVDAQLDPPVSESELRRACVWDVAVLHPGIGLVGFGAQDARRVSDLLEGPDEWEVGWDAARPGVRAGPRLASVSPERPLTLEIIIEQGRGDIGSQPQDQLPPAPGEPKAGAHRSVGRWFRQAGAKLIVRLTKMAPEVASGPTWVNALQNWAASKLAALDAALQTAREREINRLRHLLDSDPDQALRYALPLAGAGSRGMATPGDKLLPHGTDFNLSSLGGGRPADPWTVSPAVLEELRRRYREAANREIRLGRHRRAAYIFAHLLGDFSSAAAALKAGGHYREAAVLYRQRLGMMSVAADCLQEGGLLVEAIEVYRECGMFEKAGDLHMRLDQVEEAMIAYRQEAQRRCSARDPLGAARLLEVKVKDPDAALQVLEEGWTEDSHAELCMQEAFGLLGRLGRHERAMELVSQFFETPPASPWHAGPASIGQPCQAAARAARVLSGVAGGYPEGRVRAGAADATRVLAGTRLSAADSSSAQGLLDAVRRLAPEDRLLARDTERFAARKGRWPEPYPLAPVARARGPVLVHQFDLDGAIRWQIGRASGSWFYAAGLNHRGDVLQLLRATWRGDCQRYNWRVSVPAEASVLLHVLTGGDHQVLVGIASQEAPLWRAVLPKTDHFAVRAEIGTPGWMPAGVLGWCSDGAALWLVRRAGDELVLVNHALSGAVVSTVGLPGAGGMELPSDTGVPMALSGENVWLGIGPNLLRYNGDTQAITLASGIRDLTSGGHGPRLVAAVLDDRVAVWRGLSPLDNGEESRNLSGASAGFTMDGLLVVANALHGEVYETDGVLRRLGAFDGPREEVVAVLPAGARGRFGVLTSQGGVSVYEMA